MVEIYELLLVARYGSDPSVRERAGMKAIKICTANGKCYALIGMSKDNKLPEKVREAAKNNIEAAGMKAIEEYAANGWYWDLAEMSKDNKLPEKVREAAKNALQKKVEQLAEAYGLKPANPLQGDGLPVEPTREFLKGKEDKDKEPQKKPPLKNTK